MRSSRSTPLWLSRSPEEAYLDVTDYLRGGMTAWATAKAIRKRIHGETALTASAVSPKQVPRQARLGPSKTKRAVLHHARRREAFVGNLAVTRFHGVGPVTARKMHALRIETGSDLRRQTVDFMHVKGYAAPETKAAIERARLLIEQAEALGEQPEDPLLLYSVLYGSWLANVVAFNGDVVRELAAQLMTLAEKQGATIPLMVGHRVMSFSLLVTGDIAKAERTSIRHSRFTILPNIVRWRRDLAMTLGCQYCASVARPVDAWLSRGRVADAEHALKDARELVKPLR